MNNIVNLENLNDIQNAWLSDLSYVDLTKEGYEKIFNEGLTVSELGNYIKNPNSPFCGNLFFGNKVFNIFSGIFLGYKHFPTNLDIVNSVCENGMGSLKIIHAAGFPKTSSSGFQAITFEDSFGNTGISYRGSDLYVTHVVAREWLESNLLEYVIDTSSQSKEAITYFNEHKNSNGNNYIYGHSLGGNLVSYVYLENFNEIKKAFSINGNPINQKLLDTKEKVEAFNNKDKFSFNIVCGDVIGQLKSSKLYNSTVNYVKNNNNFKPSFLSAHLIQAAELDNNGNFVKITEKEMIKQLDKISLGFVNISKFAKERLNKVNFKLVKHNDYKSIVNKESIQEEDSLKFKRK